MPVKYYKNKEIIDIASSEGNNTSMSELLDFFYPIGIYIETSDPNFDPNISWGGYWVKDTKGLVTVGAYTNGESEDSSYVNTYIRQGEIIGENEHQLTINEMPAHMHDMADNDAGYFAGWGNRTGWHHMAENGPNAGRFGTAYTGGNESHNNIQPSIGVYRWHRMAPYFKLTCTLTDERQEWQGFPTIEELKMAIKGIKTSVKNIKISSIGGLKATNLNYLLQSNSFIQEVDLSELDTSEVTDMSMMFSACTNLSAVNISNINTNKVTTMEHMFYNCTSIEKIDMSKCTTENLTNTKNMFCTSLNGVVSFTGKLNEIDISNMDFSKVTKYDDMFGDIPSNCLIKVKDAAAKQFVLKVRSDFTNIQIKS